MIYRLKRSMRLAGLRTCVERKRGGPKPAPRRIRDSMSQSSQAARSAFAPVAVGGRGHSRRASTRSGNHAFVFQGPGGGPLDPEVLGGLRTLQVHFVGGGTRFDDRF